MTTECPIAKTFRDIENPHGYTLTDLWIMQQGKLVQCMVSESRVRRRPMAGKNKSRDSSRIIVIDKKQFQNRRSSNNGGPNSQYSKGKVVNFPNVSPSISYEEEQRLRAPVQAAITAFEQGVNRYGKEPFELAKGERLCLEDSRYSLPKSRLRFIQYLLSPSQEAEVILDMLRAMRDKHIRLNSSHLSDENKSRVYCLLPLELSGREQFARDLEIVASILPNFGLTQGRQEVDGYVDYPLVWKNFEEARIQFLEAQKITGFTSLVNAVAAIGDSYDALPPEISDALRDRRLAFNVACQVMRHSPELFAGRK